MARILILITACLRDVTNKNYFLFFYREKVNVENILSCIYVIIFALLCSIYYLYVILYHKKDNRKIGVHKTHLWLNIKDVYYIHQMCEYRSDGTY